MAHWYDWCRLHRWHTEVLLTPPALPPPRIRLAELRTPELPDLGLLVSRNLSQ
jgi:hypothetical protein